MQEHQRYEAKATSTVRTLASLSGEKLADVVRQANRGCANEEEGLRLWQSNQPVDKAVRFLRDIRNGSAPARDALCRNPELNKQLTALMMKANRILNRDNYIAKRKCKLEEATKKKIRTLRDRDSDE